MENRNILTENLENELEKFDFINMDSLSSARSMVKNDFVLSAEEMETL